MQATDGHPTVGVGFNMDRPGAEADFNKALGQTDRTLFEKVYTGTATLTDEQVNDLFEQDLKTYTTNAEASVSGTSPVMARSPMSRRRCSASYTTQEIR